MWPVLRHISTVSVRYIFLFIALSLCLCTYGQKDKSDSLYSKHIADSLLYRISDYRISIPMHHSLNNITESNLIAIPNDNSRPFHPLIKLRNSLLKRAPNIIFGNDVITLYGYSTQYHIAGIGRFNDAYVKARFSSDDDFSLGLGLYANRINMVGLGSETFSVDADFSYHFNPYLSITTFGSYYRTGFYGLKSKTWINGYHYGGFMSWKMTPQWKIDMGVQACGNTQYNYTTVMPVFQTTYRNRGHAINADFSGLLRSVLWGLFFNQ